MRRSTGFRRKTIKYFALMLAAIMITALACTLPFRNLAALAGGLSYGASGGAAQPVDVSGRFANPAAQAGAAETLESGTALSDDEQDAELLQDDAPDGLTERGIPGAAPAGTDLPQPEPGPQPGDGRQLESSLQFGHDAQSDAQPDLQLNMQSAPGQQVIGQEAQLSALLQQSAANTAQNQAPNASLLDDETRTDYFGPQQQALESGSGGAGSAYQFSSLAEMITMWLPKTPLGDFLSQVYSGNVTPEPGDGVDFYVAYREETDADTRGMIKVGKNDTITYCLDFFRDFSSGANYWDKPNGEVTYDEVKFILNNSYPILSVDQVKTLWDLNDPTNTLSDIEVYFATQYAIWWFTNSDQHTDIKTLVNLNVPDSAHMYYPCPLPAAAKDLFDKLIYYAANQPSVQADYTTTAYSDSALRFQYSLDVTDAKKISPDEDQHVYFGPYEIHTNTEVTLPVYGNLSVQISYDNVYPLSSSSADDLGFSVCYSEDFSDEAAGGVVKPDKPFYIHISNAYQGGFEFSCELLFGGEPADGLPYLTSAHYLYHPDSDYFVHQEILHYGWNTGIAPKSPDPVFLQDLDAAHEQLTVKKISELPDEFSFSLYVLDRDYNVVSDGIKENLKAEDLWSPEDFAQYIGKGYRVILVEEWENFDDNFIDSKFVTQTTAIKADSETPISEGKIHTWYFPLTYTPEDFRSIKDSDPPEEKPSGTHYCALEFEIDEMGEAFTIDFENEMLVNDPRDKFGGEVTLAKELDTWKPVGDRMTEANFQLHMVDTYNQTSRFLDMIQVPVGGSVDLSGLILDMFRGKENQLDGMAFVIIEDFPFSAASNGNHGHKSWTQVYLDDAPTPVTLYGYESPLYFGTYSIANFLNPGYRFDLSGDVTIMFRNIEEPVTVKKTEIGKKYYLPDDSGIDADTAEFTFGLYEVGGTYSEPAYTLIDTFKLKGGSAPEKNDIVALLEAWTSPAGTHDYADGGYFGKTFAVIETSYSLLADSYAGMTHTISVVHAPDASYASEHYYSISGGAVTRQAAMADGLYKGIEFTISVYQSDMLLTFVNTDAEQTEPKIMLDKVYAGTDMGVFDFHLYEVSGGSYIHIRKISVTKNAAATNIFSFIKAAYPDSFYNRTFALVEAWRNDSSKYWGERRTTGITTVGGMNSVGYYSLTNASDPAPAAAKDAGGEWSSAQCYRGVEFTLIPSNISAGTTKDKSFTFENKVAERIPAPGVKHAVGMAADPVSFYIYRAEGDRYTYLDSFTLTPGGASADIFSLIAANYYECIGQTFAIIEDWPYSVDSNGFANSTTMRLTDHGTDLTGSSQAGFTALSRDADFSVPSDAGRGEYGPEHIYPALIFTMPDMAPGMDLSVSFTNQVAELDEPVVILEKAEPGEGELCEDGDTEYPFYLYAVIDSQYVLINDGIALKRGASDGSIFDYIKEWYGDQNVTTDDMYALTYALVEDHKFAGWESDPYDEWWHVTTIDMEDTYVTESFGEEAILSTHGYLGADDLDSRNVSAIRSAGAMESNDHAYPYFGCEFTLPPLCIAETGDPGVNQLIITFTNVDRPNLKISAVISKDFTSAPSLEEAVRFYLYSIDKSAGAWELVSEVAVTSTLNDIDFFALISNKYAESFLDYTYVLIEKYQSAAPSYGNNGSNISTVSFTGSLGGGAVPGIFAIPEHPVRYYKECDIGDEASITETDNEGDPYYTGFMFSINKAYLNPDVHRSDLTPGLSIKFTNEDVTSWTDPVVKLSKDWEAGKIRPPINGGTQATLRVLELDAEGKVAKDLGTVTRDTGGAADITSFIKANAIDGDYRGKTYIILEEYRYQPDIPNKARQATAIEIDDKGFFAHSDIGYVKGGSINAGTGLISNFKFGPGPAAGEVTDAWFNTSAVYTYAQVKADDTTVYYPAVRLTFPDASDDPEIPDGMLIIFKNEYTAVTTPKLLISKTWTGGNIAPEYESGTVQMELNIYAPGSTEPITFLTSGGAPNPIIINVGSTQRDIVSELLTGGYYYLDDSAGVRRGVTVDYLYGLAEGGIMPRFVLTEDYTHYAGDFLYGTRSTALHVPPQDAATGDWSTGSGENTQRKSYLEFSLPPRIVGEQILSAAFENTYVPSSFSLEAGKNTGDYASVRYVLPADLSDPVKKNGPVDLYLYSVSDSGTLSGSFEVLRVTDGASVSPADMLAAMKRQALKPEHAGCTKFMLIEDYEITAGGTRVSSFVVHGSGVETVYANRAKTGGGVSVITYGSIAPGSGIYCLGVLINPSGISGSTVTFVNEDADAYKYELEIVKLDESGNPFRPVSILQQAVFDIYVFEEGDAEGSIFSAHGRTPVASVRADAAGNIRSGYILSRDVKYTVAETNVPSNVDALQANMTVAVIDRISDDYLYVKSVDVTNVRIGAFDIMKRNSKGSDYLTGAVFELYKWHDGFTYEDYRLSGEKLPGFEEIRIGTAGPVRVSKVPYGVYALIETQAPTGYEIYTLDSTGNKIYPVTRVTVDANNNSTDTSSNWYAILNHIGNTLSHAFDIIKADGSTLGDWEDGDSLSGLTGLPGASFEVDIYMPGDPRGPWVPFLNFPNTTGQFTFRISGANAGSYRVFETAAPEGFVRDEAYYYFEIQEKLNAQGVRYTDVTTFTGGDENGPYEEGAELMKALDDATGESVYVILNVPYGELKLSKTVTGAGANMSKRFEFKVVFEGNHTESIKADSDAFASADGGITWTGTLAHDETVTFSKIPFGTGYTVEETDYSSERYTSSIASEASGVVSGFVRSVTDEETGAVLILEKVNVTNTYKPEDNTPKPPDDQKPPEEPDEPDDEDKPEEPDKPDDEEDEVPDDGSDRRRRTGGDEDEEEEEPWDVPRNPYYNPEHPEDYPEPGGKDRSMPPVPNLPTNVILPMYTDDGELFYMEFDEDGVPLGGWFWDDDDEMWFFDDMVPLGEFPATGKAASNPYIPYMAIAGAALVCFGIFGSVPVRIKMARRLHRKRG